MNHNCIQGWSAIAQWAGVPVSVLMEHVRPLPGAKHVAFDAFDDRTITEGEGRSGYFYGTIPMYLAAHSRTILAMETNGEPALVDVTVLDSRSHHVFTPFLYRVATALLELSGTARPVRDLVRKLRNVEFRLARVTGLNLTLRRVETDMARSHVTTSSWRPER